MFGYTSGQDGAILPARDTGFVPQVYRSCFGVFSHIINLSHIINFFSDHLMKGKGQSPWCNNKYGLLTEREVKMARYWPHSFFACLYTRKKKKNLANI